MKSGITGRSRRRGPTRSRQRSTVPAWSAGVCLLLPGRGHPGPFRGVAGPFAESPLDGTWFCVNEAISILLVTWQSREREKKRLSIISCTHRCLGTRFRWFTVDTQARIPASSTSAPKDKGGGGVCSTPDYEEAGSRRRLRCTALISREYHEMPKEPRKTT